MGLMPTDTNVVVFWAINRNPLHTYGNHTLEVEVSDHYNKCVSTTEGFVAITMEFDMILGLLWMQWHKPDIH